MTSSPPASGARPGAGPGPRQRNVWVSMATLLLGMLLAALDQTIVATALPTIVSDLGGLNHLSWVVTAYLLAATAATPLWGKLGDQYGRKRLYQGAIVLFLIGSALCGLARSMPELIAFRAVQGLGGGGLMVLSMAIVGDLVPPRERGRYQGLFGAVFGTSSVLGPLLGGLFVDHVGWRWVFYVNLPLGALALLVIAAVLHLPVHSTRHSLDLPGIVLVVGLAVCLVLMASLGGTTWAWGSWQIGALAVLAALFLVGFVRAERRATEPVLPLRLFALRTFTLCAAIGFIVGFAMFGALTYLPIFLQIVRGVSPTLSGVYLLPMVAGTLVASTLSGLLVTRTGRWKVFPVLGTGVTTIGLLLLHQLDQDSGSAETSGYLVVFGLGLGMVIQILVLAVQNAVGYADLGVATSGVSFFRSIGAAFGVAVLGTIFSGRLSDELERALVGRRPPPGADPESLLHDPRAVGRLPAELRHEVLGAYSDAITDVFGYAAPVVVLGFALSWFLREQPLRRSVRAPDGSETIPANPVERSSRDECLRALSLLSSRAGRHDLYRRVTEHAELDLSPVAGWLLLRIRRHGTVEPALLADHVAVEREVVAHAGQQLEERGLAAREGLALLLSPAGQRAADLLARAREEALAELLGDWWTPDRPTDLTELVRELNAELSGSEDDLPRHD